MDHKGTSFQGYVVLFFLLSICLVVQENNDATRGKNLVIHETRTLHFHLLILFWGFCSCIYRLHFLFPVLSFFLGFTRCYMTLILFILCFSAASFLLSLVAVDIYIIRIDYVITHASNTNTHQPPLTSYSIVSFLTYLALALALALLCFYIYHGTTIIHETR